MARKERALHMQLYPGWSARDNYAQIGRKKKRPRDKNEGMCCSTVDLKNKFISMGYRVDEGAYYLKKNKALKLIRLFRIFIVSHHVVLKEHDLHS